MPAENMRSAIQVQKIIPRWQKQPSGKCTGRWGSCDRQNGIARRGLLVRHLVLPGGLAGTAEIMEFIAKEISQDTYINIMAQCRPEYRAREYPPLNRRITSHEYREAIEIARNQGCTGLPADFWFHPVRSHCFRYLRDRENLMPASDKGSQIS